MADIKKLIQRNRFLLEILGIVAMSEFVVVQVLSHLAPQISGLNLAFVDTISLLLISAPLIIWRSRTVHGRETQILSEAVQSASQSILLLDLAQRIRWVNEGFTRMTGYTLDEAMGQTPEILLGSDRTAPGARKLLRDAVDAVQACRVQMCVRHKDGRLIWVDIDFRPDFDKGGRLVGFLEICTDITELTLAKSSLQASLRDANALRQTIDMHAIVSGADRSGRISQVNDAFCAISGYSREQLLGSNHRILNSGAHAPQFWIAMWNEIAHGKPWRGEICNRNRQGQLYWVDSMIAPFLDADGQVEKYKSISVDITARKLLEQERAGQSRLLDEVLPLQSHEAFLAPLRTPRLPGLRVLVVEDNPINQRVMKEMLVAEGAIVCLADNGQQGVEAIRASLVQQGFDVVLMDIQMPVMDGYQATREIRHGLLLQHLPIIAVSANVGDGDRLKSLAAGMNLHIGKPYVRDELVAEIQRLTALAPAEDVPALLDQQAVGMPAVERLPSTAVSVLQVYWIQDRAQRSMPNGDCLLQQGVMLHLLDSVDDLCTRIADGVDQSALVLAEMATITSAPMRDFCEMIGAGMKPMALVVLADAVTDDDIQECIRAGAVDMVSLPYVLDNLGVIARKHINAEGELRVDLNNEVVAIDGHGAMMRIQASPPFFGSLLRTFLDELPLRIRLLQDDWHHEPGQVKQRSHALRGLAVTLGLNSLAQVARQAEEVVPQQGEALDPALLLQLEGEMQSARFQILRWLSLEQTSGSPSP